MLHNTSRVTLVLKLIAEKCPLINELVLSTPALAPPAFTPRGGLPRGCWRRRAFTSLVPATPTSELHLSATNWRAARRFILRDWDRPARIIQAWRWSR